MSPEMVAGIRSLMELHREIGWRCHDLGHARFEEGSEHFFAYCFEAVTGRTIMHGELVVLGVLIGVLPGLGGANGIAILLPLTFTMPPTSAIIMLSCIYWGALFGGAITSILFNIPGEPWSVATTFDGYPMAQRGQAAQALTAAFTSSFIGAFIAVLVITFLAPLVAKFALNFGPPEFFAVQLLTFCSFVGMTKGAPWKTLAAMFLGFTLAAIGMDNVTGQLRLTFGVEPLRRAQHQQPRLFDFYARTGDRLLHRVVVDHRPAERPTFGGPRHHQLYQYFAGADGTHAVMQARRAQPSLDCCEALPLVA